MRRRTYLAVTALALGGCAGASESDPTDEDVSDADAEDDSSDASSEESGETTDRSDDAEESGNGDDDGGGDEDRDAEESESRFGDFEDLSQWTALDGSISADAERSVVGSQSALLEADAAEERVLIKREFDEPRDLSTELPSLAVAADREINPWVQLTDTDGDRIVLRTVVQEGLPLDYRNFGIADVAGDPDLSAVDYVKISAWAGDGRSIDVWCDDLQFVDRPDTGKVMIQFDGSYETTYTDAFPVLSEYDYPATAFVSPDRVGEDGHLDLEQIEALHEAGWTIGSEAMAGGDLTWRNEREQSSQIGDAISWLGDHGFEEGARFFAYPLGEYDEATIDLVADHHDLAFASGFPAHGAVTNAALAPRVATPDVRKARAIVDRTARFGGITTINYRELGAGSSWAFASMLQRLHQLESAGELEVITPGDLYENHLH